MLIAFDWRDDCVAEPCRRSGGNELRDLIGDAGIADLAAELERIAVGAHPGAAVGELHDVPVAVVEHELDPTVPPPLTATEYAHYRWLLCGLLDGAFAAAGRWAPEFSAVPDAIDGARELIDELFARWAPEGDR